jgi:ABC-type siderophore export system fused ATPase/permease subunit
MNIDKPMAQESGCDRREVADRSEQNNRLGPSDQPELSTQPDIELEIRNLCYAYRDEQGKVFSVGPLNYTFRSGEIIFITGGNGSGKSTLAKLITGLYPADEGDILLNHKRLSATALGQYFSAIFSDSFLFGRLYGIDYHTKEGLIQEYLKVLELQDKLTVTDGQFSKTKLSTGQRKRLALLVSYLEDRQIYLFDEWAADQDPEFRKFFYHRLITELKNKGKCVIAITHDDHYFHLADKVIKMNMGKME